MFVGRSNRRPGFALLGILVVVVAVLLVAAAAATGVAIANDHRRVALASAVILQVLDSSRFSVVRFQSDVGEYPGRLRQLRTPITATDRDICNNTYSTAERNEWGAPYLVRAVTTTGMWTGIGMARDSLGKDPLAGTPSGAIPHALVMIIDDVDPGDARLLNTRLDPEGEATPSAEGRVRWGTADSEGRVVLHVRKTITQC